MSLLERSVFPKFLLPAFDRLSSYGKGLKRKLYMRLVLLLLVYPDVEMLTRGIINNET